MDVLVDTAAALPPGDCPVARDGVWSEGMPNQESMIIGDLDLPLIEESRKTGTVLPLRDSTSNQAVAAELEAVAL